MKPVYLLKSALLGGFLFATASTNAQMVGTDVFLRGQYVELGVGNLGFYGSGASAPSGYHPHAGVSTTLGFVSDPAMDGWATGTPAYTGDYFVPGMPFEGWELQVNGKRALSYNMGATSAFSYGGGMGPCTGSNTSYTTSGSVITGTWLGFVDSLIIKQETFLDTNNTYFNIKVTLTNTAVAPKNDIYYFRTLDPDNDQSWPGGGFPTKNIVEHQVRDTTVVSAEGYSSSMQYLALGTTDTNSTAVIYNAWPIATSVDLATIFNQTYGTAYYNQGTMYPGDIAIGLVTYIPHIATVDSASDSTFRTTSTAVKHPKNTATINFFYAFSAAGMDSAIVASNKPLPTPPPPVPTAVKNANTANAVKVYPNPSREVLNISGLNTTDRISMYDMMGKAVANDWTIISEGLNTFSMKNIPAGSYIIVVKEQNDNIKARVPVRKL